MTATEQTPGPVEIRWPDGTTETVTFIEAGDLLDKFERDGDTPDDERHLAVAHAMGRAEIATSPCPQWCNGEHLARNEPEHGCWVHDGYAKNDFTLFLHMYKPTDKVVRYIDANERGIASSFYLTADQAIERGLALLEAGLRVRNEGMVVNVWPKPNDRERPVSAHLLSTAIGRPVEWANRDEEAGA